MLQGSLNSVRLSLSVFHNITSITFIISLEGIHMGPREDI